jgi:hypothetical protein
METPSAAFVALNCADVMNVEAVDPVAGRWELCFGVPDVPLAHFYQFFILGRRCPTDVHVCLYSLEDWAVCFPGGTEEFYESMRLHGHPSVNHLVRASVDHLVRVDL